MEPDKIEVILAKLLVHRGKRPVQHAHNEGTIYISEVVDWRIEQEAVVDDILERAGY